MSASSTLPPTAEPDVVAVGTAPARNYELTPKGSVDGSSGDGELLEVAMGPHHPSTHGVFRMDVDG